MLGVGGRVGLSHLLRLEERPRVDSETVTVTSGIAHASMLLVLN
jgi:hypothetical protein